MTHPPIVLETSSATHDPARTGFLPKLRLTSHSLLSLLMRLQAEHEQRIALSDLDDRLLADIGCTRAQARRESSRWS